MPLRSRRVFTAHIPGFPGDFEPLGFLFLCKSHWHRSFFFDTMFLDVRLVRALAEIKSESGFCHFLSASSIRQFFFFFLLSSDCPSALSQQRRAYTSVSGCCRGRYWSKLVKIGRNSDNRRHKMRQKPTPEWAFALEMRTATICLYINSSSQAQATAREIAEWFWLGCVRASGPPASSRIGSQEQRLTTCSSSTRTWKLWASSTKKNSQKEKITIKIGNRSENSLVCCSREN